MKNRFKAIVTALIIFCFLTGCGANPELTQFRNEVDAFCTAISEIDTSINNVDADSDYAIAELLIYLKDLDAEFEVFAELDFPEEFDYLEVLADEASEYMTTAVNSYQEAYEGDSYNEVTAEYAKENYIRAYKRIQIIISFLHGEEPDDVDLTISE
ncbi:MAG: hypothetical protein J6A94_12180 [Lachnospiraceae bacterium]|nr:hypothetical protein [Lachnospiraceae bacterium]